MFADRASAGEALARLLAREAERDTVVLALPRGGLPVAVAIADALNSPLDLLLVRKVGAPMQPELALAAVAGPGGAYLVVNEDVARALGYDHADIERLAERQRVELRRRERVYLGDRPRVDVRGRTAIVVDDGAATGATMLAALKAIRAAGPARVVAAVPVASREAMAAIRAASDEAVCAETPRHFNAVGMHYRSFPQVSDDEVRDILASHPAGGGPSHS